MIDSRQFYKILGSINYKLGKLMALVEVEQSSLDAIASNLGEIVFALQTEIDHLSAALPTADLSWNIAQSS